MFLTSLLVSSSACCFDLKQASQLLRAGAEKKRRIGSLLGQQTFGRRLIIPSNGSSAYSETCLQQLSHRKVASGSLLDIGEDVSVTFAHIRAFNRMITFLTKTQQSWLQERVRRGSKSNDYSLLLPWRKKLSTVCHPASGSSPFPPLTLSI